METRKEVRLNARQTDECEVRQGRNGQIVGNPPIVAPWHLKKSVVGMVMVPRLFSRQMCET